MWRPERRRSRQWWESACGGKSQVLKGESVECCTVWAGLPAALVSRLHKEEEVGYGAEYDEFVTQQGVAVPASLLMETFKITQAKIPKPPWSLDLTLALTLIGVCAGSLSLDVTLG